MTLAELFHTGYGLNPAIDRDDDRPAPPVIAKLRRELGTNGRILGLDEELLPNVAMRYGLRDIRNYDSVELARSLAWFAPLFDNDGRGSTSRRPITWAGVLRARERLRAAAVAAIVADTPPPKELGARRQRVGDVWIAWLDADPLVTCDAGNVSSVASDHGLIQLSVDCVRSGTLQIRQTYDPGWKALVDGEKTAITPRGRVPGSQRQRR